MRSSVLFLKRLFAQFEAFFTTKTIGEARFRHSLSLFFGPTLECSPQKAAATKTRPVGEEQVQTESTRIKAKPSYPLLPTV